MTTKTTEEQWREEFREYFDKNLKPKKETIKNLDREIIIDFISNLLSSEREALMRKAMECIPGGFNVEAWPDDGGKDFVKGFNDCREQTLQELNKLNEI